MTEVRLKLSAPWTTYVNEVTALLDGDPEIAINYDNSIPALVVATNNGDKAAALRKLLPEERVFGNITLKISVDGPTPNRVFVTNEELLKTAFTRNPALSFVQAIDGIVGGFTYVVFKNCVVQFFNDNLGDIHGIASTLYEDIARDVFVPIPSVVYNTDIEHKVGKPLGEWP